MKRTSILCWDSKKSINWNCYDMLLTKFIKSLLLDSSALASVQTLKWWWIFAKSSLCIRKAKKNKEVYIAYLLLSDCDLYLSCKISGKLKNNRVYLHFFQNRSNCRSQNLHCSTWRVLIPYLNWRLCRLSADCTSRNLQIN